MINHFIERVELLKKIDSEYYSDSNLITELLICLKNLYSASSPSFKDIIDRYSKICYDYSIINKFEYIKIILDKKYEEENIYYEDKEFIVFVFEHKEYCVSYTLCKENNKITIDDTIFDSIICDLIEDCIDELTL